VSNDLLDVHRIGQEQDWLGGNPLSDLDLAAFEECLVASNRRAQNGSEVDVRQVQFHSSLFEASRIRQTVEESHKMAYLAIHHRNGPLCLSLARLTALQHIETIAQGR
jgi:hypothetical protein